MTGLGCDGASGRRGEGSELSQRTASRLSCSPGGGEQLAARRSMPPSRWHVGQLAGGRDATGQGREQVRVICEQVGLVSEQVCEQVKVA